MIKELFVLTVIENGKEEVMSYPSGEEKIPMIAGDKKRLNQLIAVADQMAEMLEIHYNVIKFKRETNKKEKKK